MIDLFSDTHTLPSPGMRAAMAAAEVGDEQMGEDPTTRELEEKVASLLGKEAALFMPTGSMCNKVAISSLTRPGDAVVCDHMAHALRFEGGGPAVLSGVVFEPLPTTKGHFTADQVEAVMNPGSVYQPRTALVALEQTHNFGGGTVWPLEQYQAVCAAARRGEAAVYTDGARLLNAVTASGVAADRWADPVDAIWIDFSKGIGAPGGAAIAGSAEFIEAANRFKYLYGGAMRQSGILAAAALYGLEHNVPRMAEDHENARALAAGLKNLGIEAAEPESNMVFCSPPAGMSSQQFIDAMAQRGVRIGAIPGSIRLVTHLGVTEQDITVAVESAGRVVEQS